MHSEQAKSRRFIISAIVGVVIIAAIAFIILAARQDAQPSAVDTAAGRNFPCTVESVYDGDGPINCKELDLKGQQVRVRLRGIEARESDNSCRHANICPKASGAEAKAVLTKLAVGRMTCTSFGPSYNRVDAACRTPTNQDVSCEMLRSGTAVRWPEYDPDERLISCIPPR